MAATTPSLWQATSDAVVRRAGLSGDTSADVAIVGAGYTGLWTAHHLLESSPGLRIVIVEREHAGFGASGRNGGWVIAEFACGYRRLAAAGGARLAFAQCKELHQSVGEIGALVADRGIDCGFQQGGALYLARNGGQLARLQAKVRAAHAAGFDEYDYRLLSADEARARVHATDVVGGMHFAHSAAVHPLRLARGLAADLESRGVTIAEGTSVSAIEPQLVRTDLGVVRAPIVIRATEGYTRDLAGHARTLAPLYSLMIATEPLDDDTWARIGLADRETFKDERHLVIYGQRTADGRIAFGGRGAPYGFGSRIASSIEAASATHDLIHRSLVELFPVLSSVAVTHRWGGVLGVPRNWFPSVHFDRTTGVGSAGGYVGDGVAVSHLAGRTLADLVLGIDSDRTRHPWVDHRSRAWEPEPLRWAGINGALSVMSSADRVEARRGRPARRAAWMWKLIERG